MKQIILITVGVIATLALIIGAFTFTQAEGERTNLSADLQYRTHSLADSLETSIEPSFIAGSTTTVQRIVDKLTDREHILGLWVFDSFGQLSAYSGEVSGVSGSKFAVTAMDSDTSSGVFMQNGGQNVFAFFQPMHQGTHVVGALMVIENAGYIDDAVRKIWVDNIARFFAQALLIGVAIFLLVRFVFFKSLSRLAESIRSARRGEERAEAGPQFLAPVEAEISKMSSSLLAARSAASEEARMRFEKLDSPWTAERLKEFVKASFKSDSLYMVSNRGSHTIQKVKNKIVYTPVAGGMTTALTPVMEACGGTWFACGSTADKDIAGKEGKLPMPPDEAPRYMLKQVLLTAEEMRGYYAFSAEAMYPLCLITHTRPVFRESDWAMYRKVNGKFAREILREIADVRNPIILVNDYHFALLPRMIKKARPDARVGIFWHVPWPNEESFGICPWREDILEGMLGADVVGFNTQQFCNHFMDTVSLEIESLIDWDQFSVTRDGHRTLVKPFPASIQFTNTAAPPQQLEPDRSVLTKLGIRTRHVGIGVDRLDYAKGIPERFLAIESLFDRYPSYREQVTFLQIAPVQRQQIAKYREYKDLVIAEAERINKKFGTRDWRPIVLELEQYSHAELSNLYRLADFCLVTSLHDSMNLVAKEYVAARSDQDGVLLLSQFAGASRSLHGALIVNPYSIEETGEALHVALSMPTGERHRRMKSMRESVKDYNIYRWAAELVRVLGQLS